MSNLNVSLPESLKSFVDQRVASGGYDTSSEYLRDLIRKDQDRVRLRELLLAGAASEQGAPADSAYFEELRSRVSERTRG